MFHFTRQIPRRSRIHSLYQHYSLHDTASVNHRWPQANIMHVLSLIYVIVISLNQPIRPPIWSNQWKKTRKMLWHRPWRCPPPPPFETSVPVASLPFAVPLAICLSALASSPHPYLSCFHPMNSHHSCFLLLRPSVFIISTVPDAPQSWLHIPARLTDRVVVSSPISHGQNVYVTLSDLMLIRFILISPSSSH